MGKTGVGVIALIVGLAAGAIGGLSLGGGAMMGAGAASGLSMGVCTTVQAAQDVGTLTPAQVDQVLTRAASNLSGKQRLPEGAGVLGSSKACADYLAKNLP
jgi:hypothetical protein